jgi:predicted phage tail protein
MDVSSAKSVWRNAGEVTADVRSYKCQHLEENNKYKFRIRAVNKVGQSEPADLQETVVAKDPWGKFFLPHSLKNDCS